MNVIIKKSKLNGEVIAPPSKSYSHRYLIASMLSDNESVISNIFFSDDVLATLNCINAMGKRYLINDNSITILDKKTNNDIPVFDCNESGSTLRFFIPIALSKYEKVIFKGSERLLKRGISIYEEILKDENGWVSGIKCIKMELGEPDASGRRCPVEVAGSEFVIDVDTVIMSLGTTSNPLITSTTKGLDTNKWSCIVADEETGKAGRDMMEFYILDHTSKGFMPELESGGVYGTEKPVAADPKLYMCTTFIKK